MSIKIQKIIPLARAFFGRFISASGVFFLSILFSRYLPLEEAGKFFEAFVWLMGLAIFLGAGLPILLIRKISPLALDDPQATGLFAHGVANAGAFALITAILWAGAAVLFSLLHLPIGWVWAALIPVTLINIMSTWFKARGRAGWGGFWEVGLISAVTCLISLLYPPHSALEGWVMFTTIAWIVCAMAAAMALWGAAPKMTQFTPAPQLWVEARFLWAIAILSYLAQWGGMLLSSTLLGTEEVAIINALFRTLAPLQFVILTLDYYLAPKFASSEHATRLQLRRTGIIAGLALALPYAALLVIAPDMTLAWIYGPDYVGYGNEMRVLILACMFQIGLGANGILLNMTQRDHISMYGVIGRAIAGIGISVLLIPWFGVMGAAAGFAFALTGQIVYYRTHSNRNV